MDESREAKWFGNCAIKHETKRKKQMIQCFLYIKKKTPIDVITNNNM